MDFIRRRSSAVRTLYENEYNADCVGYRLHQLYVLIFWLHIQLLDRSLSPEGLFAYPSVDRNPDTLPSA